VVFCNVGQGDAALVSLGYFQMLLDTGPLKGGIERCLSSQMPLGDKKIEVVVISHQDSDHSGALASLEKSYRIERVYGQKNYSNTLNYNDSLEYGEIVFKVLYPDKGLLERDNDSIVGLLKYREMSFLFTGDIDRVVEESIIDRLPTDIGIDVLKVSHHGSKTASGEEWLLAVMPKWAVVSVGNNSYGHPDSGVLANLQKIGSEVMRTDKSGDIVFEEK
jgi:beta-lactamase superfamily II metal-dependent hydrolase